MTVPATSDVEWQVILGDCVEVMEGLPDKSVHLILADPPYPGRKDMGGGKGKLRMWLAPMPRLADKALVKWSAIALPEAAASIPAGWKWQHTIVWHKPWTNARHWVLGIYPHWEAILVLGVGGRRYEVKDFQDVIMARTLRANMDEDVGHPMQTPESLIEVLLKAFSAPGDTVLDPFCGSGTVGAVCRRIGRRFIGIERDPYWCEVARERISRVQFGLGI